MPNELARRLAQGLGSQSIIGFGPMTLVRVQPGARDPQRLTAGRAETATNYPCKGRQGVKSSGYAKLAAAIAGDMTRQSSIAYSILGASLTDGVTPRAGDRIVHSGSMHTIAEGGATNPDGIGAVWECYCEAEGG